MVIFPSCKATTQQKDVIGQSHWWSWSNINYDVVRTTPIPVISDRVDGHGHQTTKSTSGQDSEIAPNFSCQSQMRQNQTPDPLRRKTCCSFGCSLVESDICYLKENESLIACFYKLDVFEDWFEEIYFFFNQ